MADFLPILTAVDGAVLAKVSTRTPAGFETRPYDNAYRYRFQLPMVDSLEDVQGLLEQLAQDTRSCVIRGEPNDSTADREVNRRMHLDKEGRPGDWQHHHEGRQWVAFDIDAFEQTAYEGSGMPDDRDLRAMAMQARSEVLGAPWTRAACVYKLSASAGLKGWSRVSMHLWFWLDRRVHDLSLRAWARGKGVDAAFFSAVQPHYTANPIFDGGIDPLAGRRMGRLPGADTVVTPPELVGGAAWHEADRLRREAQKPDIAKGVKAAMADIKQSKSAVRSYVVNALQGVCGDILGAAPGTRHGTLMKLAFKVGGWCQPDALSEFEAAQALTTVIERVFEAPRHAQELRTMREMLESGAKNPHDLSHLGKGQKSGKARLTVVPPPEPRRVEVDGANALELEEPAVELELKGTRKDGSAPMNSDNLRALLKYYGIRIGWNEMAKEADIEIPAAVRSTEMRDNTRYGRIRELCRHHQMGCGQAFEDAIAIIEDEGAYHPARNWVTSKPWDGVDRFKALWGTIVLDHDHQVYAELYREQLYRWCIGAAKLATLPKLARGSKYQIAMQGVLVLQGPQGRGKTEWFKGLAPKGMVGTGVTVDPSNKDDVIRATSTWLTELGEIDSTVRKADVGHLKAFLTSATDTYRRAYARVQETYIRQTAFGASVNPKTFLRDPTGNRRFWTIPVERLKAFRDEDGGLPSIDMQQLWAQMAHEAKSEHHWLDEAFTRVQESAAEDHRQHDALEDEVLDKLIIDLDMPPAGWMTTDDIYLALQPDRPSERWSQAEKNAVARTLSQLGAKAYRGSRSRKWSVRRK